MKKSLLARQTLFMTAGYPGAGKSYLARQLASSLGIARVSADRIRFELFEEPKYTPDEDAIVFRILDYITEEYLSAGLSVICDGDFNLGKSRRLKYELARKHKVAAVTLWVQTDLETAFTRASRRDGRKPDDKHSANVNKATFDRLVKKLKKPTAEPVIVFSGKHIFRAQQAIAMKKLQQMSLLIATPRPAPQTAIQATKPQIQNRRAISGRPVPRAKQTLRVKTN